MKYIESALIFIFVCFLGFFIAWIGGVEPFTEVAGAIAFLTIWVAGISSSLKILGFLS